MTLPGFRNVVKLFFQVKISSSYIDYLMSNLKKGGAVTETQDFVNITVFATGIP